MMLLDLINRAETAMREMPQVEVETNHYFADGMYARELIRAAGTLIVGKVHKREHFYIVTKGAVQVAMGDDVKTYTAPAVIVSKPGTKRAVFALEDSVCMTIHRTDNTDLDLIEEELIEESPLSLFNAHNKLKALT
jgi:hypothetical protein